MQIGTLHIKIGRNSVPFVTVAWLAGMLIMVTIGNNAMAKDQVSPKSGAIPNGFFHSAGEDKLDFAIVRCRQSYDVLKCHIQLLENTPMEGGQCQISLRQMREDMPWQTDGLDGGKDGHWGTYRANAKSRCKVERGISFSRSKEGGRFDLLRFTRQVKAKDVDEFCKTIPELDEVWRQVSDISKTPGCDSFTWKKQ